MGGRVSAEKNTTRPDEVLQPAGRTVYADELQGHFMGYDESKKFRNRMIVIIAGIAGICLAATVVAPHLSGFSE